MIIEHVIEVHETHNYKLVFAPKKEKAMEIVASCEGQKTC